MFQNDDEKAFALLEKAVDKAQTGLMHTHKLQPFLMLLNEKGEVETFENKISDSIESYTALEKLAEESVKMGDVDILVLVADTLIPEKFVEDVPQGIRLHLEEKSQSHKKISARYIYVPYELCQTVEKEHFINLHQPIAVGFPAEYIVRT